MRKAASRCGKVLCEGGKWRFYLASRTSTMSVVNQERTPSHVSAYMVNSYSIYYRATFVMMFRHSIGSAVGKTHAAEKFTAISEANDKDDKEDLK